MAEGSNSGSTNGLYFIVGGLVVIVGVFAYVFLGGRHEATSTGKLDVTIQTPKTTQ
jgi:hypothetical protein